MALIQNLAQGQEELRVLINKLRRDGCNQMGQTSRIGDQVIIQPPLRQEAERRPPQFASASQTQQPPRQQGQGNRSKQVPAVRQFTKLDMPISQVLQHLLNLNLVTLRDPPRNPNTSAPSYHPNALCAYHSNNPGHDTNDCWALKNKIQDLIDRGVLEFTQGGQTEFFCRSLKAHHLK